ncbi:MAG: hypothetical protein J0I47_10155 [Sphingomonas sp.]|uniref:hypothetical protein n=1 Tax=Sphingomonas sp. TaxID=28214 RepID=UPI001AC801ED|nr:hypothetical protein [Sphingomonas sp.]MBN8808575.1 hypothetical protein [Sphingomonas sp.]
MVRTMVAALAVTAMAIAPMGARPARAASVGGADTDAACYLFSSFQAVQAAKEPDKQRALIAIVGFYAARVTTTHPGAATLKTALDTAQATLVAKRADAAFTKELIASCLDGFNHANQRINAITSAGVKKP